MQIKFYHLLNNKLHRLTSSGIAQSFVTAVNLPATLFTFGSKLRAKSLSSVFQSEAVC